jgi:hypothetical protein
VAVSCGRDNEKAEGITALSESLVASKRVIMDGLETDVITNTVYDLLYTLPPPSEIKILG